MEIKSLSKRNTIDLVAYAFRLLRYEKEQQSLTLALWDSSKEKLNLAAKELSEVNLVEDYVKYLIWNDAEKLSKDFSE